MAKILSEAKSINFTSDLATTVRRETVMALTVGIFFDGQHQDSQAESNEVGHAEQACCVARTLQTKITCWSRREDF